jgi:outer membrane protein assembly factor BamB
MPGRTNRFTAVLGLAVVVFGATGCGASQANPSASTVPNPAPSVAAKPSTVPVAGQAPAGRSDWAGFRGDAGRLGVGVLGPTGNPMLNWQFQAGGGVPNSIAIVGDVVYFASDDEVVHAVSRSSGSEIWSVKRPRPTVRGPLAADGRLYFADDEGTVFALEPSHPGEPIWQTATAYPGTTELISVAGTLSFGTGDGRLVGLDGATGAEEWAVQVTADGAAVRNPAYADGRIFAGTAGAGFIAVDLASHQIAWTADLDGDDTGTASAGNGVAYIATPADATTGRLHALDAKTGKPLWIGPSPMLTTPNVVDGVAYSSTMQGLVEAIDASTGKLRWSVQLSGKIRPMAVVGTTLYLSADTEQRVYAIETTTGSKLWQFDVDGPSDCCIAVAGGAVFVGTLSGSVYSIGGDGTAVTPEPFATAAAPSAAPPATQASTIKAPVTWSTDLRGMGFAPIGQIAVDPHGRIWAPEAAADRIAILNPSGKVLDQWGSTGAKPGQFDFTRTNGDGYGTLAFAGDGFVLRPRRRQPARPALRRPSQAREDLGWLRHRAGAVRRPGRDRRGTGRNGLGARRSARRCRALPRGRHRDRLVRRVRERPRERRRERPDARSRWQPVCQPDRAEPGRRVRPLGQAPPHDRRGGVFAGQPSFIAIDSKGRLFVTQGDVDPAVTVFDRDGTLLGKLGTVGLGPDQLAFPAGIALDGKGGLYIGDTWPDTARMVRFALPADLR